MAPPGELNLLKEPQLKDKDKESYNGYITTTVASLDRPPFTSWTLLNGKVRSKGTCLTNYQGRIVYMHNILHSAYCKECALKWKTACGCGVKCN
ncbi:hypothetical protein OS493_017343 [Desmophyllum pertusum]|uniref:Uncharacterized protein n=1 Tax=Desmophyllum pertusum TaxID=174260 RepID=A0A9X0D9M9_9CNID|nr:hypothetical protein OS493_017343 [Desmophyllum pertusum]